MRRNFTLLAVILLIAMTGGCNKPTVAPTPTAAVENQTKVTEPAGTKQPEPAKEQSIEVEKNLLNVEVKLPASLFKGANIEEVIAEAKKSGVSEVTKNDDGSITYKMPKAIYNKMLKTMEESTLKSVEDIKNNKDLKSIKDLSHNKSFSEFTVTVDQKAFKDSFDGFALLGLYVTSAYYQLFSGADANTFKTTILLKDAASGEVFETIVYPDALNKKDK